MRLKVQLHPTKLSYLNCRDETADIQLSIPNVLTELESNFYFKARLIRENHMSTMLEWLPLAAPFIQF